MAGVVKNLAPAGAITQGQVIGALDFGTGADGNPSIWTFALCVFNSKPYLFGRHSSAGSSAPFLPFDDNGVAGFAVSDMGVLRSIIETASQPPLVYKTDGAVYASAATETGWYTDGAGNFQTKPYTATSNADTIKSILQTVAGDSSTTTTGTGTATPAKKWFQTH
ncbi:hypothetical protein ACFFJX_02335 [Pseudarcicella hirudinis]|uniref:hypothetical protein n=1 Tax=Pseudarcicella hirudinis TaxID=1079859 RepID=UPI0035EA9540